MAASRPGSNDEGPMDSAGYVSSAQSWRISPVTANIATADCTRIRDRRNLHIVYGTQILVMKAATLLIACLLAATAPGTATAAGEDLKDLARDTRIWALKPWVLDVSGLEIGTAFFVSADGRLVTNHHVAAAHQVEAVHAEGPAYAGRGGATDKVNDLAVLRIDAGSSRALPLATDPVPEPGERVVVLGGRLGLVGSLPEGIVAAIRDPSEVERRKKRPFAAVADHHRNLCGVLGLAGDQARRRGRQPVRSRPEAQLRGGHRPCPDGARRPEACGIDFGGLTRQLPSQRADSGVLLRRP